MVWIDFEGAPHGGRKRALPEGSTSTHIDPVVIILHSIVGSAEGAYVMFRDHSNLESHFIIDLDGEIWQLVDTNRRADANLEANAYGISIETADRGDPDTQEWTLAQLDSIDWLLRKLTTIHSIPRMAVAIGDCNGPGVGYHTMHGAPSCWTPVSKTCPGIARKRQFPKIITRLQGGSDVTCEEAITALRRDLTVFGTTGLEQTVENFASRQRDALAKLDILLARQLLTDDQVILIGTEAAAAVTEVLAGVSLELSEDDKAAISEGAAQLTIDKLRAHPLIPTP